MRSFRDFRKYQEAVKNRDWVTCDLIADENEELQSQLKETEALLKEACDVMDRTYKKPVMGNDTKMEFLNKPEIKKLMESK